MEKCYRLTKCAKPFERDGKFQFRVRYDVETENGGRRIRALKACPLITIPSGGVISTTNITAQAMIGSFLAPNNTKRNGKRRERMPFFEDVTATHPSVDVDLDKVFDTI